ncbi:MAG: peptidase C39 family protein [Kiloniellales bacterium]
MPGKSAGGKSAGGKSAGGKAVGSKAAGARAALRIRPARLDDLPALLSLEERCFAIDRMSRRSFRHLLTRANGVTLVEEADGAIRGYAAVLFHRGTSLARLYSLAVDPQQRGKGIGAALLAAAEQAALEHDAAYMRLEVHQDNRDAQTLYEAAGYHAFAIAQHYYEDDGDAIRMEKALTRESGRTLVKMPYHEQTLEFTCGPAALLMAMRTLESKIEVSPRAELRLWREATTIFMTSGHGGCSPFGLALAAARRGFRVEVHVTGDGADFFVDSVRKARKKDVIRLVQQDFIDELREMGVALHKEPLSIAGLRAAFERGGIPLVLVSTYRLDRKRAPHWVTVTGFDDRFVYLNDPFVDRLHHKSRTDCVRVPVPLRDFDRMTRYGKARQQAVVVLTKSTDR